MKSKHTWTPILEALHKSQLCTHSKKDAKALTLEPMTGERTMRLELNVLVETQLITSQVIKTLIQEFDKQFNDEVRQGRPKYASSIHDSGSLGEKYGIHALFNNSALSQHAHIDGIGRPGVKLDVKSLSEYDGPLSVAFHLTHHLPTSVGDSVNLANMIYETKGEESKCKHVAKRLNALFKKNSSDFDVKEQTGTKVEPGTAMIIPKNAAIHRGAPRGNEDDGKWRIVLYWDMCLEDDKQRFETDDMETAEYPMGFEGKLVSWREVQGRFRDMCPSLPK
jgi:hypothetical protein